MGIGGLRLGQWPVRIFVYPHDGGAIRVWHPRAQFGNLRYEVEAIVQPGNTYESLPFTDLQRALEERLALLFWEDGSVTVESESVLK